MDVDDDGSTALWVIICVTLAFVLLSGDIIINFVRSILNF